MIISDNFVYIHVPKTGGSSFEKMLENRQGLEVVGDQHDIAADIPEEHLGKFIFGFLRDPISAEFSNWRYHRGSWKNKALTFESWCEWRYGGLDSEYGKHTLKLNKNQVAYGHIFNIHPSAGYFCNADGECIADRIFRYEDIVDSTKILSDTLGIDCDISEYKVLGSEHPLYEGSEVTPRCEELIRKAKGIDFAIHEAPGEISTDFNCPTVPNYAYSREGCDS